MPKHELGSGPIQDEYRVQMNAIARVIDEALNGDLKGPNRTVEFVLLVFPYGTKDGRCNYISNGADRSDMVKLLREQANRFDTGAM